ncbi:MAG: 7-cyano-7-deazaguanine synthase [Acidobacteria bacterium]|nr:7-cyano-7-deazaguanine synthase [Acidobacteriota bacterium]
MISLPRQPCALLCSGGIESCALAFLCSRQAKVHPIYVRFGLTWEDTELSWLRNYLARVANENLQPLVTLDQSVADLYKNHWSRGSGSAPGADDPDESVYLPGRNLLLLAKTAVFCSLSHLSILLLGTLQGNPFLDARPEFFSQMARSLSLGLGGPFQILAPFCESRKEEIIQLAAKAPLELSFSCIRPKQEQHCGKCNKCGERKKHFRLAGIEDTTLYAE